MLTKEEYGSALLRHSNSFEKTTEIKFLKLMDQRMEFLIERINFIERILIDDDDKIKGLMEWTQNQEMKQQSICLMRQRFLMELDVKLTLEMALFDCLDIIADREDLSDLSMKTNNFVTGINLRNVLAHGIEEAATSACKLNRRQSEGLKS
ncbi:hypothetical protein AVEN_67636-1 [Araneus ventricosus]|uniref:Uncharacterized protein n=1 Tax=Araneus ventricosus TaxID=182803 RepID=A0A4Y2PFA0_ARAVE|nr:hypothetical protein AVEN_97721-1 [Araneus ventricosus]GBN49867.1 hypothetical protein AVEN_67636-1 [Araneus ventricosus]